MSNSSNFAWRVGVVALVALMAVGAFGCRRRARTQDGRAARYQRNLVRLAARQTGCPAAQLTPVQIGQQPGVYSVTGCAFPVEYWLRCGRRARHCSWEAIPPLNQQAAAPLQCQPQMVQQQMTQSPNMRIAAGCGRQATFAMACNGAACGWAMSGGMAAGPPVQQPPATYATGATAGGTTVTPTNQPPEGAAVQAQLQQQREVILSCIDQPTVNLTVRWTAQGMVQVALPPELAGTAAEGCIQAALGTLQIAAQQAGQVVVPVQ